MVLCLRLKHSNNQTSKAQGLLPLCFSFAVKTKKQGHGFPCPYYLLLAHHILDNSVRILKSYSL